jgi:hypothetical protein
VSGPCHSEQIIDLGNPFPILVWVYLIWNGYHFGMQTVGRWPSRVRILTAALSVADEMCGFGNREFVPLLAELQTGGSGRDPRWERAGLKLRSNPQCQNVLVKGGSGKR